MVRSGLLRRLREAAPPGMARPPHAPRAPRSAPRGLRRVLPAMGLLAPLLGAAVLVQVAMPWAVQPGAVVRLRVVANSNRLADQRAKLQVRNAVLAVIAPAVTGARSAPQLLQRLDAALPRIRRAARSAAPAGQAVRVALGPDRFPNRRLAGLFFPGGLYETLLVTLGAGAGHNWWTVLFPPFAFIRVGGRAAVVGPSGAASTPPGAEPASSASGPLTIADDTAAAAPVRVRFALWDAWLRLRGRMEAAASQVAGAVRP